MDKIHSDRARQKEQSVNLERLHLGCGEQYREEWHNVDFVADVEPDELVNLNEYPWPWEDSSFIQIDAEHVFEHLDDIEKALKECKRILRPGGKLRVVLPMGLNSIADPDHSHIWTWQTPEFYCGKRHWDTDCGLDVVSRNVDMHSLYPSDTVRRVFHTLWGLLLTFYGPGEWCFNQPAMSGSFEIIFRA
jgi:predicted SAM-dependent methyltransferase